MHTLRRCLYFVSLTKHSSLLAALVAVSAGGAFAQQSCSTVPDRPETPALKAYAHGNYHEAQEMYEGEMILRPNDQSSAAGLIQSLLREGKLDEATTQAAKLIAANPTSAIALTAQAEVQLHQGQPWLALETLTAAEKADGCYARIHYVRSRVLRMDSQYSSERAEVLAAYQIDGKEPDIHRAWVSSVEPAHEIMAIYDSLATEKNIDAETRKSAERSISDMMPLLSENNQTCKVVPVLAGETTIPLAPIREDAQKVSGYRLEAELPQTKVHLIVDTAASGLFISRAVADQNGLEASVGAPAGTVHVDRVKIGGLEFRDCTVGVSGVPFVNNADGFVGTDIFAPWLIDLDHPRARLTLKPLPGAKSILPIDRPMGESVPAELRGFSPVYHRNQYLLVPVTLNGKSKRLFVLDSGYRVSTMTSDAAHAVSSTKIGFTNAVQTVGGATIHIYRDAFDLKFASLELPLQGHIMELEPTNIQRNSGIQVAGLLGFDILHSLDMQLDYRDGLVRFESAAESGGQGSRKQQHAESSIAAVECPPLDPREEPLNTTIQAKVETILDSNHLKPGSQIILKMVTNWQNGECYITQDSPLYGHVNELRSNKAPASSELSLTFDQVECLGGKKRYISLKVLGLIAPPDQIKGLQSALPTQVAGGGRSIEAAAHDIGSGGNMTGINLNPDGPPNTIKPGIVKGIPGVTLEPQGGPACSAKITSVERSIHMGSNSQFILMPMAPAASATP